jgi:tetratricopeptide (TPR) repeat protein
MRKILFGLSLLLLTQPAGAEDFYKILARCNSHVFDQKLMRACGMLATQIQMDPVNRAIAYYLRAKAYINLNKADYAITDTTQVLALLERPSGAPANVSAGSLRMRALAVRSTGYNIAGKADLAAADRTQALALATAAIEALPSAANYHERAFIYHLLGDDAHGLPDAMKAWEMTPRNAEILETRGEIYENLGNRTAALADYRAALEADPNDQHAQEALTRIAAAGDAAQKFY